MNKFLKVTYKDTDETSIIELVDIHGQPVSLQTSIEIYRELGHTAEEYTPNPDTLRIWEAINCTK